MGEASKSSSFNFHCFINTFVFIRFYLWHDLGSHYTNMTVSSSLVDMKSAVLTSRLLQQVGLLILLIYPMIRLRMKKVSQNAAINSERHIRLTESLKRYLIWTSVVVLTDIIAMLITSISMHPKLVIITKTVFSADMLINHISLLATYRKSIRILTVFFRRKNQIQPANIQTEN